MGAMRDLRSCLGEYSLAMLGAIAAGWGVAVRGDEIETEEQKAQVVEAIAAKMLSPEAVAGVLSGLSDDERHALARVAEQGIVQARSWTRQHGEIERMGGGRLEKSRPWLSPANPAQRLWYLGLVYRGFGVIGAYRGEVYFVPPELLNALPRPKAPKVSFQLEPAAAPASTRRAGMSLARDILAVLSYVRRQPVKAQAQFLIGREAAQLTASLADPGASYGLFLQRLIQTAGFLRRRGGRWQPSLASRDWLQAAPLDRMRVLLDAWSEDPDWDELEHVGSLRTGKAGIRHDAREPRRRALELLARCKPGEWYGLSAFVQAVKAAHPDFARPDGDYDSWYVQDAETGAYLTGFASWDAVEGALLAHYLTGPLHWLGAVDFSVETLDGGVFGPSPLGAFLLGIPGADPPASPEPALMVDEALRVRVPLAANLYDLYQLERFAELESVGDPLIYAITRSSVMRSLEEGVEIAQIIAFLRRATAGRLPEASSRILDGWAAQYGRVRLANVTLLMTRDEATMAELRGHPRVRPYLSHAFSARVSAVDESRAKELVEILKEMDYWPRVEEL